MTRQRRPRSSPRTTWGGTPRSSWPTKPCARKTAGKQGESSSAAARHATGMASALTGRKRITSATHKPVELCLHRCTLNTENGTSRTSSSVIQTVLRSLTVTRAPRVRSAYLDMYIEIRVSPACHLAVGPGRRITITRSTSARCSCSTPSSQVRSANCHRMSYGEMGYRGVPIVPMDMRRVRRHLQRRRWTGLHLDPCAGIFLLANLQHRVHLIGTKVVLSPTALRALPAPRPKPATPAHSIGTKAVCTRVMHPAPSPTALRAQRHPCARIFRCQPATPHLIGTNCSAGTCRVQPQRLHCLPRQSKQKRRRRCILLHQ